MATAGRILIIPRGEYDENVTYNNLDLVSYKGDSWLAKKTAVGIEPSAENAEYWFKMTDMSVISEEIEDIKSDIEDMKAVEETIVTDVEAIKEDITDINSNLLKVKSATFTGTTSANGNVNNVSVNPILGTVFEATNGWIGIPYYWGNAWSLHIIKADDTNATVGNTNVSFTYYYLGTD